MPDHSLTQIALVATGTINSTCKWQIAISGDPNHHLDQETGERAICEIRIQSTPDGVRESHLLKDQLYREDYIISVGNPLVIKGMLSVNTPLSLEFSNGVRLTGMLSCRVNHRAIKSLNTSEVDNLREPKHPKVLGLESKETLDLSIQTPIYQSLERDQTVGEMVLQEVLKMEQETVVDIANVSRETSARSSVEKPPASAEVALPNVSSSPEPPTGVVTSHSEASMNTNQIQRVLLIGLSFLVLLCVVVLLLLSQRLLMLEEQLPRASVESSK